jgi:hypothetical protein
MKKFICASFVLVAALFACMQRSSAAIVTEPFLPRPGDTVKVTIAGYCLSIERWEQTAGRIIFYGVDSYVPIQTTCFDVYQTSITNVGPFTRIEVWGRADGPPQPPDGYSLRDGRGVKVDALSARRDPPTSLRVTSGIALALSREAARSSYGALVVRDAAGQPVESARVSIDLVSRRGPTKRSYDQAIPRSTSSTGVAQFGATEAYYAAFQPGDYVTYTFTLTDTLAPKPARAFAVVGIVSPQFAPYAFPVVEYQPQGGEIGAGFFLESDAATMQTLDALPTSFPRTYGAFTGLTANAPDAVPVCRFFSDGRNGRALTHWYTADAAECAAKRADPNWIYEGTPFWTIPARADGYCPPSTRAVRRLLYSNVAKPASAPARYTQDLASINASLDASGSASGRASWIDDGVAFCAPE